MKGKFFTTLVALGGLGAVVVGGVALQPQSAQARDSYGYATNNERHPEINRAIHNLEQARTDAQHSNRDFGGHRAKAASLINQAIAELQQAKRYDNRH